MDYRKIATDAVGAGSARIQNEDLWNRLPPEGRNSFRLILERNDSAQYCWDAYCDINLGNPEVVPNDLSEFIIHQLRSESERETITFASAMNGGSIIEIERDKL